MYIYICRPIHIYVHIQAYAYLYTYMYVYTYIYIYIHMYVCVVLLGRLVALGPGLRSGAGALPARRRQPRHGGPGRRRPEQRPGQSHGQEEAAEGHGGVGRCPETIKALGII